MYSRDQISNQQSIGFYIVNMDDSIGQGTHWIAFRIKPDKIEYFDSFGIRPPREVKVLAKVLNLSYVYNNTQYQDLKSVLCGYYCIYWVNESSKGYDYWDIVKEFSQRHPSYSEKFITHYFKNI